MTRVYSFKELVALARELRLKSTADKSSNANSATNSTRQSAARVLIIDDDPTVRSSMRALLEAEDYEVLTAQNADEGLAHLGQQPVHAIVSDIIMPGMTGTDFLAAARRLAPDVEVLLITGEPTTESALSALRGHAFDYLSKPIDPEKLLHVLAHAVEFGRAHVENRRLTERLQKRADELEGLVRERTAELSRLSAELIRVQDAERKRISRELHDSIGQALLSLRMELQRLHDQAGEEAPKIAPRIDSLIEFLAGTTESCRQLSHAMNPLGLSELGLEVAIRELAEGMTATGKAEVSCVVDPLTTTLDDEQALHLYRIVQESLVNALRHASAANVFIILRETPEGLRLVVRDDGQGITQKTQADGMGLAIMRERAALCGGTVQLNSTPGSGTEIRVTIARSKEAST